MISRKKNRATDTCLVVERVRLANLDDFVHNAQLQHPRCGGGGCRRASKNVSDIVGIIRAHNAGCSEQLSPKFSLGNNTAVKNR